MVRQCFSITAVLAGVVLMMAADSSQAQRRFGRRFRDNNYDTVPGTVQPGNADAIYYPSVTSTSPLNANQVFLELRVPPDAEIIIGGEKTTQRGNVRRYVSPPVSPGRMYTYDIVAKWMENGREITRNRSVQVQPGQRIGVDLTRITSSSPVTTESPRPMPSDDRRAYYPPDFENVRAPGNQVLLEVRVPPEADILIEGQKTTARGNLRRFLSPPLTPGHTYTYEMTGKWMENGREVTRNRTLEVRPGQQVQVDLTQPSKDIDQGKGKHEGGHDQDKE